MAKTNGRIGYKISSQIKEEGEDIESVDVKKLSCETRRRFISYHVTLKAQELADQYINNNNAFGESALERLKELKKIYYTIM